MPPSPFPARAGVSRRRVVAGGAASELVAVGLGRRVAATAPATSAATLIHNARVFTAADDERIHQALALAGDGTILAAGSDADLRALAGPATETLDADGATVMPGIVDGHVHPLGYAEGSLSPSVGNATGTVTELQNLLIGLLAASADQEPDGWLSVRDWNPVGLEPPGTLADRTILDALATRRPIILQGSDYHNALVNTRALELAGVDADTPDPPGGQVARDAAGQPTGLLKDIAQDLVRAVIPPPPPAAVRAASVATMRLMLANGITSFLDAWTVEAGLAGYAELAAAGELKQRVVPALEINAELATDPAAAMAYLDDLVARYGDIPNLAFGTVKVFLDGVIEYPAQTAALLAPYLGGDGTPGTTSGDLYVDGTAMAALVTALDAAGWQVHSHAIGDRAVRTALDAYEAALAANGDGDRRHTIAHLQLVDPADYPRFAATNTIACMQLQWAVRNEFTLDALEPFIGPERFERLYPAQSLAAAGAMLSGGSDWPVDPLGPFNQLESAIRRIGSSSADEQPLNGSEGLERLAALAMHTRQSAHQLHLDDTGTLEAGRQADVIVLDRDITDGLVDEIKDATVRYTFVGGELVYDADSAARSGGSTTSVGSAPATTGLRRTDRSHAHCGHPH